MPAHGAGFAPTAGARGDDEIMAAAADRIDEQRHQIAAVGAVAVDEDNDPGLRRRGRDPRRTGPAIAPAADGDDTGADGGSDRRRAVLAAAVDDDDFLRQFARDLGYDGCDRLRFVEGRDDNGDGRSAVRPG